MTTSLGAARRSISGLHPGEAILFTGTVYLTWLQMLWSDARVQVTSQRLLWEPFANFSCEMPLGQIEHVSSMGLVVLTRTVIRGVDGTEIAVVARGRGLVDALENGDGSRIKSGMTSGEGMGPGSGPG